MLLKRILSIKKGIHNCTPVYFYVLPLGLPETALGINFSPKLSFLKVDKLSVFVSAPTWARTKDPQIMSLML